MKLAAGSIAGAVSLGERELYRTGRRFTSVRAGLRLLSIIRRAPFGLLKADSEGERCLASDCQDAE